MVFKIPYPTSLLISPNLPTPKGSNVSSCSYLNIEEPLFYIASSLPTLKGSNIHNPGLQFEVQDTTHNSVWRLIWFSANWMTNTTTQFRSFAASLFLAPSGRNIYNPGLQSGVQDTACNSVWRLICALANKMSNTHSNQRHSSLTTPTPNRPYTHTPQLQSGIPPYYTTMLPLLPNA